MIDFGLTDELDLKMIDGVIVEQDNNITSLLEGFFTDARVNTRGYWLDIITSELWRFDQSRNTAEDIRELEETAKETAEKLVEGGIFKRINTEIQNKQGVITLLLECFDENDKAVIKRQFAI